MGREVRKVIPNWEHPKRENGGYKPLYDKSYDEAMTEWLEDFEVFKRDKLDEASKEYGYVKSQPFAAFADYQGTPPDPEYYRPYWKESDRTWFQVYETVSEGTPVSPPFATQEELIDYLVKHGDFWAQKRGTGGVSRESAERFVKSGWAPSAVIHNGVFKSGLDCLSD